MNRADAAATRAAPAAMRAIARSVFSQLPPAVLANVLARSRSTDVAPGHLFMGADQPAPYRCGVVVSGLLRMFLESADGRQITIRYAGPGYFLGAATTVAGEHGFPPSGVVVTRFFGNEATGDVDGDGTADVAFLLTQGTGGSGTFYYVVVALHTKDGYVGTNAVLLGDRVAPQTTLVQDGNIVVNYAERRPGEAMTAQPSVGVTKTLGVVAGRLVER